MTINRKAWVDKAQIARLNLYSCRSLCCISIYLKLTISQDPVTKCGHIYTVKMTKWSLAISSSPNDSMSLVWVFDLVEQVYCKVHLNVFSFTQSITWDVLMKKCVGQQVDDWVWVAALLRYEYVWWQYKMLMKCKIYRAHGKFTVDLSMSTCWPLFLVTGADSTNRSVSMWCSIITLPKKKNQKNINSTGRLMAHMIWPGW
jgi:hypothetical protein